MDPLTAVSLASAIVQFIDFSTKIMSGAREMYSSTTGATEENRSLAVVVAEMQQLTSKMTAPRTGQPTEDERALYRLAAECQILSDQLLGLLDKVRAKDPRSKVKAAWAALRSKLHEREMLELQRRLDGCRSQLDLQLGFLSSSETKARLDALTESATDDSIKLDTIQTHVKELRQGVAIASLSAEAQQQLRGLLGLSQDVFAKVAQQKVLKVLAFPNMHGRFDAVEEAHAQTFEWIFENDSVHHDTASTTLQSFVEWLSSGDGIFHISGKLGSGKSTLMKYLCGSDRTSEELQRWAGNRKLVFASFFFWKPGSAMQKSLHGLFRCLLYDTLKENPELIPTVLPDLWDSVISHPWQSPSNFELQTKTVAAAFSRLLECPKLYEKHCFCFFIDGLDEYEETHHADYKTMIKILSSWTETAPGDVKLCVSSREYNVFLNFFSEHKRLRLQDLTNKDMERYIHDRLEDLDESYMSAITSAIMEKADGIFLWVTLVLKSIRTRLDDGYDFYKLQDEIDSLPDELEGLFEYLLKSISKTSLQKACQTFALVDAASAEIEHFDMGGPQPLGLYIDLVSYSFLEEYDEDPSFASKAAFPWSNLDDAALSARKELARRRLNGHCKGLVELSSKGIITYTHRTVPEFLSLSFKASIESALESFQPQDALSQLLLAELRTRRRPDPDDPDDVRFILRPLSRLVHGIVTIRKRYSLDQEPYEFLECLETTLNRYQGPRVVACAGQKATLSTSAGTQHSPWHSYNDSTPGVREPVIWLTSPFDISAFVGHRDYVEWKMERDPSMTDSECKRTVLACSIEFGARYRLPDQSLDLLARLLSHYMSPETKVPGNPALVEGVPGQLSIWEYWLLGITCSRYRGRTADWSTGEILGIYLEQGANPNIRLAVREPRSRLWRRASQDSLGSQFNGDSSSLDLFTDDEDEERELAPGSRGEASDETEAHREDSHGNSKPGLPVASWRSEYGSAECAIELLIQQADGNVRTVARTNTYDGTYRRSTNKFHDFVRRHGGEISLVEFIEYCNFDNKRVLFEILGRNGDERNLSTVQTMLEDEKSNVSQRTTDHEQPQELDLSIQPPTLLDVAPTKTATRADTSVLKSVRRWDELRLGGPPVIFLSGMAVAMVLVQLLGKTK